MSKKTKAKAKRKKQKAARPGIDRCCCGDEFCDGTGPYPQLHRIGQEPNKRHQEDT